MSELGPKMLMSTVDCPDFAFFTSATSSKGLVRKEAETNEVRLSENYKECQREIRSGLLFGQF